jgi:hypothetical protein
MTSVSCWEWPRHSAGEQAEVAHQLGEFAVGDGHPAASVANDGLAEGRKALVRCAGSGDAR